MPEARQLTARSAIGSLALIAAVVAFGAAAFAYTAGWFSPDRLTPDRLVAAFKSPQGGEPPLGHRRNHAKGICFTGMFEANGAGSELSRAQVFAQGQYPVLGRFNLGTPNPNAPDATVRVRGLGLSISTPDGQEWRMAMINPPVFAVSTPQAFYELLRRIGQQGPECDADFRRRPSRVREVRRLGEERALDRQLCGRAVQQPQQLHLRRQFRRRACGAMVDDSGGAAGRRVARGARQARPRLPRAGDRRADPRRAAALDHAGDRRQSGRSDRRSRLKRGRKTAARSRSARSSCSRSRPSADGPCRDINFDPTVLPSGIRTSDDPFPAARSAAYARSYDLRTSEAKDYPRTPPGASQ